MCAWRCFDAVDTMNNMNAGMGIRPKFVIADIDTYRRAPKTTLYANFPVNYLKLDTVPGPDQDWSPVLKAHARRQLLREHRRNSHQELRGQRHRQSADDHRGRRMDVTRWRSWRSSRATERR